MNGGAVSSVHSYHTPRICRRWQFLPDGYKMQFTSPLFIFIFLPLMAAAQALTPAHRRRWTILACGLVFYVLANLKTPVSILFLAVSAAFAYCAAYAVYVSRKKPKKTVLVFSVFVCIAMLVVLRVLGVRLEAYNVTFLPLGVSVYLLAAVSMLIDISRGDAEPPASFADALLYIGFFPVLVAGPIIKYKDFIRKSSDEELEFSLTGVANGLVLFARGFIKRIGVSAILAGAYDDISSLAVSEEKLNLGVGMFLVLLMLTNVYFAFSGYSDMGRGLALIMGIKLDNDFHYPFAACTPFEYINRFFVSLTAFLDDYLAQPLERMICGAAGTEPGKRDLRRGTAAFLAGMLVATLTALWFKASLPMLVAFLPLILLSAAERTVRACGTSGGLVRRNLATRIVGRVITLALVSLFWTQLKLRSVGQLVDYFRTLTVIGSYQSYRLYMTIYNREYLFAALVALWLLLPALLGLCGVDWSRGKAGTVLRTLYCGGIIALFVFSIYVVMPQYPEYAMSPFKYITF